jgi:hypothetical protein
MARLVIVESPYAGEIERNVAYARAALRDCLDRGEFPLASHLLYPQVLRDGLDLERALGINAGLAWALRGDVAVFYLDLGWSGGMLQAARFYESHGFPTEGRRLGGLWRL